MVTMDMVVMVTVASYFHLTPTAHVACQFFPPFPACVVSSHSLRWKIELFQADEKAVENISQVFC